MCSLLPRAVEAACRERGGGYAAREEERGAAAGLVVGVGEEGVEEVADIYT
jgi:hypothetical protein